MNLLRSVSLLALSALAVAASAQTVETYSAWDGSTYISTFGNPDTSTYGQTLTATSDTFLKSYTTSFNYLSGGPFTFQFYVADWDAANSRIGSLLYTSGVLDSPSGAGFQSFTIDPNVAVQNGQQYVVFSSTSAQLSRPDGFVGQADVRRDAYAGGDFVFQNNGSDFSLLSTQSWQVGNGPFSFDATFSATFGSISPTVPGPVAALPFALMALKRRKRA